MPKKPAKSTPAKGQQPEPAQLKAIERRLSAGDFTGASERARALVQRFHDHGTANRMLVESLYQYGDKAAAALAAYQWAQCRPNSTAAQEALLQFALEANFALLAYRAGQRLAALGAIPEPKSLLTDAALLGEILQQPDGSQAPLEETEQFELGKLYAEAKDFAGAVRALEGVALTPARNNRALALFYLGRSEEALTGALAAWQQDTDNLFALGLAVQMRLYRGDETGARGLAVPLAQAVARRLEDAQAQLAALLLIGENQAAWDAFERSNQAPWIGEATGALEGLRLLFGGAAASRLGRGDQARALWKQALARYPGLALARENLTDLDRDGQPPAYPMLFDLGQVVPLGALNALRQGGAAGLDDRLNRMHLSNAYLEAIYLSGDASVRGFAAHLLRWRLGHPDPTEADPDARRAATILLDLARLPIGTTEERLGFLAALRDHNQLGSAETIQFWGKEGLQEVCTFSTEITREPEPSDLPADLQARLEASVLHVRTGRLEAAEAELEAVLARIPDHQAALGNLAVLRARQDRDQECRELLRRTIAAHPDYLFARVNLASFLIEDGELDEAKVLLDGLAQRPRLHIQEAFALYGVLAMLSRARGDEEDATGLIASLERMVENENDERMLKVAKARVEKAAALRQGQLQASMKRLLKGPLGLGRSKRR